MNQDIYENCDSEYTVELDGITIGFDKVEVGPGPGAPAYTDISIKSAKITNSHAFLGAYGHQSLEECVDDSPLEWARNYFEDAEILLGGI